MRINDIEIGDLLLSRDGYLGIYLGGIANKEGYPRHKLIWFVRSENKEFNGVPAHTIIQCRDSFLKMNEKTRKEVEKKIHET